MNNNLNSMVFTIDIIKKEIERDPDKIQLLLIQACDLKKLEIIKWIIGHIFLIQYQINSQIINNLLLNSCENEEYDIFTLLSEFDFDKNYFFKKSCESKNINIINKLYDSVDKQTVRTGFIMACFFGNQNIIEYLFSASKEDRSLISYGNCNSIYNAFEGGHYETVMWLIDRCDKKINFNKCFIYACRGGEMQLITFLIKEKKVNIHVSEELPLRIACFKGNMELADLLLKKGANLKLLFPTDYILKYDPIKICLDDCVINAYQNNHLHIIMLLCKNVNINIKKYGIHPTEFLINACKQNNEDAIDFMYDYCKENNHHFSIKTLICNPNDLQNPFPDDIVFFEAVQSGNLNLVKKIYNLGLVTEEPVNIINEYKPIFREKTIFEIVEEPVATISENIFYLGCKLNYNDIIEWLFEICYNLNVLVDLNSNGCLCLRAAYENDNLDLIKILINMSPVKLNYRVNNDYIFLDACKNNNVPVVEWLVQFSKYYYVLIVDGIIVYTKIFIDEIYCSLLLKEHRYVELVERFEIKLSRKIDPIRPIKKCVLCKKHDPLLITKCNHRYCFECLFVKYINGTLMCDKCNKKIKIYECKYRHSLAGWLLY